MKKGLLRIIGLIVVIGGWLMGKYNTMVTLDEGVNEAWAQVENVYQRRSDLIPNLVKIVQGYAAHEQDTFAAVTQARASATQTRIDINDAESFAKFQQSQGELSSALSRLMAISENYPELKANKNFLELQSQLEGTENRIAVERKRFNEVVLKYNVFIRSIPNNLIAGFFNFEKAEMFAAEEGADKAPDVSFEKEKTNGAKKVDDLTDQIEATDKQIELLKKQQELDALKAAK